MRSDWSVVGFFLGRVKQNKQTTKAMDDDQTTYCMPLEEEVHALVNAIHPSDKVYVLRHIRSICRHRLSLSHPLIYEPIDFIRSRYDFLEDRLDDLVLLVEAASNRSLKARLQKRENRLTARQRKLDDTKVVLMELGDCSVDQQTLQSLWCFVNQQLKQLSSECTFI